MLNTCCELMLEAYQRGMITSRDGNISLRSQHEDHWYLSPSNVRKNTLDADQFKKLSLELDLNLKPICLPYTHASLQLRPSGEYPVHYLLQKTIPDGWATRVVMHVHSTYTVAAMHAGIQLENLKNDFPEIAAYTRVAPSVPDVQPVSWQLAQACVDALKLDPISGQTEFDIVGVQGHGVFSVAETAGLAYEHIERLDHIARIVLLSKAACHLT